MTLASATAELTLIVAGDPDQLTGGYLYDARIVAALRERGWRVEVAGLAGRFPDPDALARASMAAALAALPDGARVVIDGLALGGLPEVVAPHADRLRLIALVHHPLADETGLDDATRERLRHSETRALALARRVIATSAYTARGLARFGVPPSRVAVVEPGVDPAPLADTAASQARREGPQRLLCVATLTPRKGHDLLVEALASLRQHDWRCDCIGGLSRDPAHAARVAQRIRHHRLEARLRLCGEQGPEALAAAYRQADLFVLASHYEGYGMVVTEALARGLPVITTTGGALADTLPATAGLAVAPGDSHGLAVALARWFEEPELRARLRHGARQARARLGDWSDAGAAFAAALSDPSEVVP
ncbi:glycosyltransferase family 4 protein [Halomonas campisalis]|uniref:Glycosyltransferase family 4 protein n=1 Tax=Billgrantia campisalis TaxID=74661 RepID=A0ABS9P6W7_9GAMM|nr:glycosyltransferase family 4 protein [Halomonas campisalis]MCG6657530.1 glycosyltransferase family 4 protein [Halomonas campisalis]MDR5863123.1 glycosyltransferase family 4 protein [Halomonas campisalis]